MTDGWKWYASHDGERYNVGPCDTREQAIAEGLDYYADDAGITIIEANQQPIDLGRFFDARRAVEHMCEDIDEECGDPDGYDSLTEKAWTTEQEKDLIERLKWTVWEWQQRHDIEIKPYLFQGQRNEEYVANPEYKRDPLDYEEDAA